MGRRKTAGPITEISRSKYSIEITCTGRIGQPSPNTGSRAPSQSATAIAEKYVVELNEDVEAFATTLANLGIQVHRPLRLARDTPSIRGMGSTSDSGLEYS